MTDSTQRFGNRADDYARYRPSYPPEIVTAILEGFPNASVADLGAGTGISARLLANAGAFVYAVEPNGAMRAAVPSSERIRAVDGTAEATTLERSSVDVVTAFQAYHWFEPPAVMREAARIAKPRARFAAVWNHRDRSDPTTAAYEAIVDRYDTSGGAIDRSRRAGTVLEDLRAAGWSNVRVVTGRHEHPLDWEALIGFVRSASYLPREGDAYDAMAAELRAEFERQSRRGPVRFVWCTQAHIGDRDGDVRPRQ